MIETVSNKLSDFLSGSVKLTYDKEVYKYGITIIISNILNTLIVIGLSMIFGNTLEALIFLIVFVLLRSFAGGYHSKTNAGCLLSLVAVYILFEVLLKFTISHSGIPELCIMSAISLGIVSVFAPVENSNKKLSGEEKMVFRKRSVVLSAFLIIISSVVFNVSANISFSLVITMFLISILIIIEILKKRRSRKWLNK